MRQLQFLAHGEPLDVTELNVVAEPALGTEDVLISMEAAPINPSDFLLVRGTYGLRPALPSSLGAEGIGRVPGYFAGRSAGGGDVACVGREGTVLERDTRSGGALEDRLPPPFVCRGQSSTRGGPE